MRNLRTPAQSVTEEGKALFRHRASFREPSGSAERDLEASMFAAADAASDAAADAAAAAGKEDLADIASHGLPCAARDAASILTLLIKACRGVWEERHGMPTSACTGKG